MESNASLAIAALGLIASVLAAWMQSRSQARKTAADMFFQLCSVQQGHIEQLQKQLDANEDELRRLRLELMALREENLQLVARIRELEAENSRLREQIAELRHIKTNHTDSEKETT